MTQEQINGINGKIDQILNHEDAKKLAKLNMDLFKRSVARLDSFQSSCETCSMKLDNIEMHVDHLIGNTGHLEKDEIKHHLGLLNEMNTHLQTNHKLVLPGHYLSTYMTLGMSVGLVFGMTLLDNLAIGLPIGLSVGIAVGSGLDADAKKKGLVI
jgi:hypothetical protein